MSSDVMANAERKVRSRQSFRILIWLVFLAAVVVFGFINTKKVSVDWVVNDALAPLWAVIGVSAVAGAIIGFIARPNRH
jgi:uncharacterized integral membrane protein